MCDGPDSGDYESFRFYEVRDVKARKPHVCACCHGAIAAGDTYRRAAAGWEGTAISEAMCSSCAEAADAYETEHNFHTMPSGIEPLIEECVAEYAMEAKLIRRRGPPPPDEAAKADVAEAGAARWQRYLDDMKARATAREAAKEV